MKLRFIKPTKFKAIKTIIQNGKMVPTEVEHSYDFGLMLQINAYSEGENNQIDIELTDGSIACKIDKSSVEIMTDGIINHYSPNKCCEDKVSGSGS